MWCKLTLLNFLTILLLVSTLRSQPPYLQPDGSTPRWSSYENPTADKGAAATRNKGHKGHAFDRLAAGDSCVLFEMKGPGMINRIWLTVSDRTPAMLRELRLDIYWDGETKPAVSAPLGDFFCNGLGRIEQFENCFFSNPEGRSMNCIIPMPFRTGARVVLTNESANYLTHLFYDINATQLSKWDKNMSYFHCYWNRENLTTLGTDYTILPGVKGIGRFLGVNIGINANLSYHNTWWGEGEVKFYLDGDGKNPTLCGTGTEDYIGTAWGQGSYYNWYQGCPIADDKSKQWAFYRFHVPDPIPFYSDCRVTLQQIGGGGYNEVLASYQEGAPLQPITVDRVVEKEFVRLLERETPIALDDAAFPQGFVNYLRCDDVSSTAYFYLNTPSCKETPLLPATAKRSEPAAR